MPHGQAHFRYGGKGPVVVMLHDSPRSSVLHLPNLEWLGEYFTVIALDTPGYGNSSPLPVGQSSIGEYSRALAETLSALGLERCAVYGFHTSSKIALQFAVDHPGRAALTLMDGLALPDSPPSPDFLSAYLQAFEPAADGSHLARLWSRILDFHRFFPWFDRRAQTRLAMALPDDAGLHEYATDVLMAGANWTGAYGAAMRFDAMPAIRALRSPAVFMCREDDVLYGFLDRLPRPLPAACRVERIPGEGAAWRLRLLELLRSARLPASQWSPPPPAEPAPAAEEQRYLGFVHGQVRARLRGRGGTPVLLLHDVPGSSAGMAGLASLLATDRRVVTPDLPGLGESQPLLSPSLGAYVVLLGEMLEQLGHPAVDVVAEGLSTPFAIALAAHRPAQVRRLVLDAVPWVRTRERGALLRHYCPPIAPDRHGAYLHQIWHQLRSAEVSWPWFDRSVAAVRKRDPDLDPARLQSVLVDVAKQLPSYGDAARAALAAAVRELAPAVKQPVLLLHDEIDVRYRGTRRLIKRLPDGRIAPRPASIRERAELLRGFLA
ncbi:MAG: alpha/beta hydrolase [Gammaproteobacteria bacterium]|nr:alpha/beta hydrolase [Gammaproteobacteria bacterium]